MKWSKEKNIKTLLRSYCTHFKSSAEVHWQSKRDCMDAIINLPFLWNAHHQKLVCLSRTHRDKHLFSHFLDAVCCPVLHQPVDHWIWDNLLFSRINNITLKRWKNQSKSKASLTRVGDIKIAFKNSGHLLLVVNQSWVWLDPISGWSLLCK